MGLVGEGRWRRFEARRDRFERNMDAVRTSKMTGDDGRRASVAHFLRRPETTLADVTASGALVLDVAPGEEATDCWSVETTCKYRGYLEREDAVIERSRRQESRRIPPAFTYQEMPGLSAEMVERLSAVRPETLGQAARVPGVTPAAVALIGARIGA